MNYLLVNPSSSTGDIDDFQSNDDIDDGSSPIVDKRHYNDSTTTAVSVQTQFRRINQNNQRSLSWNISLRNDQDEVSENFLKMYDEPTTIIETIGSTIYMIPENIKKQADELFKPSEINLNEIFSLANTKVSWILSSSYQQYLKSIPQCVLEKKEKHVLYPWTQWNTSTGPWCRPLPNSLVTSPATSSNRSLSTSFSSSSSLYAHRTLYGRSFNNSNNNNSNSFSYGGTGTAVNGDPNCSYGTLDIEQNPYWTMATVAAVRSPSDRNRSVSSADFYGNDRSPPIARSGDTDVCWPSRLYYCVNVDNNTINKLVEHYCTFCYKNHEPPEVYGSHLVRDATRTTCPKLRALKCKHCNGTGDNAHTIKYCPFLYANYS